MTPFLEFQQVGYSYPRQEEYAVRELSFTVYRGEFVGILGADDAGKSTLAKLANGLILPSNGEIILTQDGQKYSLTPDAETLYQVRQLIGMVFSDPENQIIGSTVEEDVAFGLGNLRIPAAEMRQRVDRYLRRFGLSHYAKQPPHTLSGGEQQKLCLASVAAMQPACLVLDEPAAYLDHRSRRDMLNLLREINAAGTTIVYLTSDPEELVHTHRLLLLKRGAMLAECSNTRLWNELSLLKELDVVPSNMMAFREALIKDGYYLHEDSLTPDAVARDIMLCYDERKK